MSQPLSIGRVAVLLVLCLSIPACTGNSNVTKTNYAKIKAGMSLAEVEAVLGKGDAEGGLDLSEGSSAAGALGITGLSAAPSRASSIKWIRWGDDKKFIRVGFQGDKVAKGKIEQQGL